MLTSQMPIYAFTMLFAAIITGINVLTNAKITTFKERTYSQLFKSEKNS